jgi:glycosyltransferase involved in cell wall biosynthesis
VIRIAVIITTYNRPDALSVVLDAYLAQTEKNFEVVVADDGSTIETNQVIATYQAHGGFKLSHVWQKDIGFRAAAIRNRALALTSADYIIFSDGDCIPLPTFVAQHRLLAEPGWFLTGNRILLSEAFTHRVLKDNLPIHTWNTGQWVFALIKKDINRLMPLLSLRIARPLRKLRAHSWNSAMTCNLSAWREDLMRINGLDEVYSGWGLEDSDLVIRLLRSGICRKSVRFAAPVLHLWHKENDRMSLTQNRRQLDDLLHSQRIRAKCGVQQYL